MTKQQILAEKLRKRQERKARMKKFRAIKAARRAAREAAAKASAPELRPDARTPAKTPAKEKNNSHAGAKSHASKHTNSEKTPAPSRGEQDKQKQRVIDALERDVAELSLLSAPAGGQSGEIERIRREVDELKRDLYTHLGAWQRLLLARHPQRPYTDDFIRLLFEDFSEIHGDRNIADDPALITGMAKF
ncbi:MAG: hypothetical protein WA673_17355, partial [Candidatus Acidiferrales bacterium]